MAEVTSTSLRVGAWLLAILAAAVVVVFCACTSPIAQPQWYHDFADQRTMVGIPHALNVASNLPFVLVGCWGLVFLARADRTRLFGERSEATPYWVFFAGLALTGVGSAYYHADPNNSRLVWDRMPLTVTFMALFTAVLAERISWRLARWLLGPLVVIGIVSVLSWDWSESQGVGDMRFYLLVQFLPLVLLPLLLIFFPARYPGTADLVAALACYVLAKVLEILDAKVYTQGGLVSGHTLKHLVAGLAPCFIVHMLSRRLSQRERE